VSSTCSAEIRHASCSSPLRMTCWGMQLTTYCALAVPMRMPQWRIDNFSELTSGDPVWSDCFEAGICTWWVGKH
jgi:hypothetical protein